MRLLVNLSTLGPRTTGLGVYATHCARAACAAFDAEVIAPRSYSGPGELVQRSPDDVVLGAGRLAPLRRWAWARKQPRTTDRLVYSPTHHGFSAQRHQVVTIHDLIALRCPSQYPLQSLYFRLVLPRQIQRCRAVITVSETSKADIHEQYRYPLEAIHVVPNGVNTEVFRRDPDEHRRGDFLLMVGASFAHKNVDEVLRHAALWKERYRLVVASCRGKYRAHLERVVAELGLRERVRFLDYVEQAELVRLYQRCAALIYPSKWEGFGIPPLEALACGARVIASDIPVHREILGAAATYVRLGDAAGWGAALAQLDAPPPAALSRAAASPTQRFTWQRSADALAAALAAIEPRLAPAS